MGCKKCEILEQEKDSLERLLDEKEDELEDMQWELDERYESMKEIERKKYWEEAWRQIKEGKI